jgi:hypothetical protein
VRRGLPLLEEALPGWRAALGATNQLTLKAQGLLGHCLVRTERFERAEPLLLDSYVALESLVGARHREVATVARLIVELYEARGMEGEAVPYRTVLDSIR